MTRAHVVNLTAHVVWHGTLKGHPSRVVLCDTHTICIVLIVPNVNGIVTVNGICSVEGLVELILLPPPPPPLLLSFPTLLDSCIPVGVCIHDYHNALKSYC